MSGGRDRCAIVLDVGDLDAAMRMALPLAPWFAIAKVGVELYAESGPACFDALHDAGFKVFADMKLYDIPNTVARAARVYGRRGVEFLNFHAVGGVTMLQAGIDAYHEGARDAGHAAPVALGVTVLTSERDAGAAGDRLAIARDAGCEGVVCSAFEAQDAHALGLRSMVPGIRRSGDHAGDQARVATPGDAIRRGADWLVVGRTVTAAADPEAAAAAVVAEVDAALTPVPG
jgi:orotidine-5'-phosphate decarboxylase